MLYSQLKNVKIAKPGCDGVHVDGENLIENVIWEHFLPKLFIRDRIRVKTVFEY